MFRFRNSILASLLYPYEKALIKSVKDLQSEHCASKRLRHCNTITPRGTSTNTSSSSTKSSMSLAFVLLAFIRMVYSFARHHEKVKEKVTLQCESADYSPHMEVENRRRENGWLTRQNQL